ncbi:hypothetical protein ODJ79_29790 [Actinoplanes sp. KI2]|uniref:hypothetical protein n=1 Tax=Actinoplanes sp. KI2 TaxID=2983315 RepID=UPI0021D5D599|nr:hypothetical protein [Actinoplanes sp. KI2]MCU7727930.1 hypothetical protein [Actinoplanes sp. KI2]
MRNRPVLAAAAVGLLGLGALAGCHSAGHDDPAAAGPHWSDPAGSPEASATPPAGSSASAGVTPTPTPSKSVAPKTLAKPGNPAGHAAIPAAARAADSSHPTRTIGNGTAASCTSSAVVKAVAAGGVIAFNCGPVPVTITMTATAKVHNSTKPVVLDGGGRVTLSGGGKRRIIYLNACDASLGPRTSHCQDQDYPRLTIQNVAFTRGNSIGQPNDDEYPGGGGAIFARGGHIKVVNSRFTDNRCDSTGPDLGGAAMRVLEQGGDDPVYIVGSTFTGGSCANGSALSSIGVSWTVLNSVFSGNTAIGRGANPARAGTPGGGSGGAIYLDGNDFKLVLDGTLMERNHANEGGGAIFFVSNDRTGTLTIRNSTLRRNPSDGFETFRGVFYLGKGNPSISGSKVS